MKQPTQCKWKFETKEYCSWVTGCGERFIPAPGGTPKGKFQYCPYCGRGVYYAQKAIGIFVEVYGGIFGSHVGRYRVVDNIKELKTVNKKGFPVLKVHAPEKCEGHPCAFHSPSNHHMVNWPMNVRLDRSSLVERVCSHGVGHPDPDSVAFLVQTDETIGVHGCDFCCSKRERIEI